MRDTPRTDPDGRSLAHPVLISDDERRSALQDRDGAHTVEVTIVRPAPSSGSTRSDAVGSVDEDCATTAPALVSQKWLGYLV